MAMEANTDENVRSGELFDELPLPEHGQAAAGKTPADDGRSLGVPLPPGEMLSLRDFRDRAEREYIRTTLQTCEWNISRAATLLGVERTNLHKKMRALGVQRED